MKPKRKKGKKKIVGKPHLLRQVKVAQKKNSNNKKKMWAILSKYFCPTFTLIFSPIWRDCVLEGEERKLVGPTKISPLFHPQPNNQKIIFSPLFSPSFSILPKITPNKHSLKELRGGIWFIHFSTRCQLGFPIETKR